jgi:putative two-component system response regulator
MRVKHLNDKLENLEKVLITIAAIAEAKDEYTEGHLERMASYAAGLGTALGLGKIGVSELILKKRGPLTAEEFAEMKEHTIIGERIVQPLRFSAQVGPIVRGHHERWNGSGYPDGLAGEEIPLGARVISVVDAYDAMTTDRPYRKALSFQDAVGELRRWADSQFDPRLVDTFLEMIEAAKERSD